MALGMLGASELVQDYSQLHSEFKASVGYMKSYPTPRAHTLPEF